MNEHQPIDAPAGCTMFDSRLFRRQYASDEMRRVWSDSAMLQSLLDAEAALADAEAELGVIPRDAADCIYSNAKAELYDLDAIGKRIFEQAHPFMAVVEALAERSGQSAGGYVHWGATTQDMTDTGLVLQIRDALELIELRLTALRKSLAARVREAMDLVCMGRTHGQHAVPTTMGLRLASHIQEFDRISERLDQLRPRVLVVQLAGAAGSLASLPEHGLAVREQFAQRLGLGLTPAGWHTMRDGFAEVGGWLTMISGAGERFARNVIALQQTEIGEAEEPWHPGKIGSSTMPHKRNPMLAEIAAGLAMTARAAASVFPTLMVQTFERDMAAWYAEWHAFSASFLAADGMLVMLNTIAAGLTFHSDAIAYNLEHLKGLPLSELLMLELGKKLGRQEAHRVIYECCMETVRTGRPLSDILAENREVNAHFNQSQLATLLDPRAYIGFSRTFAENVLKSPANG